MMNLTCSTDATQGLAAWLNEHAIIDEEPLGLDELDEQLCILLGAYDDGDQSDSAIWGARIEAVENLVIAVWDGYVWIWLLEPSAVAGASETVRRVVDGWREHSLEEQTAALRAALVAN